MAEYSRKHKTSNENNEIVDTLLKLPSKNLEVRIDAIESEISERQKMRNHILTKLETNKSHLKTHKDQLRYISLSGHSPVLLQKIASDLLEIDNSIAGELRDCFRDISRLKERLQEAREELIIERQKLAMISPHDNSNNNGNRRRNRRPSEKTKASNGR